MSNAVKAIILVLGSLSLLAILGILSIVFLLYWSIPHVVTDVSQYSNILHHWPEKFEDPGSKELTKHFPDSIPPDATNARLAYFPGCLQAGSYFQVRFRLSPEKIRSLYQHFRAQAAYRFKGGYSSENTEKGEVLTTQFFTSDSEDRSFPESYELLVLRSEGTWHMGRSCGVAIDRAANDIVYWVDTR